MDSVRRRIVLLCGGALLLLAGCDGGTDAPVGRSDSGGDDSGAPRLGDDGGTPALDDAGGGPGGDDTAGEADAGGTGGRAESCNGLDDDRDGAVDDGLTRDCLVVNAEGRCGGVETCVAGGWVGCTAPTPTAEACNGADDDCDGSVDEGCACEVGDLSACYTGPAETRGRGACRDGSMACHGDGTWGECTGDTRPSAEACDGADNDCDGATDEDVGALWYEDADADGFGATAAPLVACSQPVGYVAQAGDCDDGDEAVNPAVDTEACDGVDEDCDGVTDPGCSELERFSFFVTSLRALQELSGSEDGFGGDLRFGETGPGAGLRGADRICAAIAERSMPGSSVKQWRAFLSATADENGERVDAIDRIGDGPWYDRRGRLFAQKRADLLYDRPRSADAAIQDDFPNEDGVPNHRPDLTQPEVDNHDMLTGTGEDGRLYSRSATCLDWTSALGNRSIEGRPRVGHSWPRSGGPPPGWKPPGDSMDNWMSALDEAGCAPGVHLIESGGPAPGAVTVGAGGGYGGFYCFALTP